MSSYQPNDLHSQLTFDSDKFLSDGRAEFLTKELSNFPFLNNSCDNCSQPLFQNSGETSSSEMMCPVDPLNVMPQDIKFIKVEMDDQCPPVFSEESLTQEPSRQEQYSQSQTSQTSFIDSQNENQVPAIAPWRGNYNFSFILEKGPTRKLSYSVKRNKLYCVPFVDIEFLFSYDFEKCVHKDMSLRAFLRYTNAQNAAVPVARCMNHVYQDGETSANELLKPDFNEMTDKTDEELVHHVMKCHNEVLAKHFRDPSGRCYITVPMGNPQPGSSRISKMFRFDCLNSCRGDKSLKKASTTVVFELLRDNRVVGRISFELRVCSCPNRDFIKSEPTADTGICMPKGEKVTKNPTTTENEAKAGCSTAVQEKKRGALTAHDDSTVVVKKRRIEDQQFDAVQLPESQATLVTSCQESVDESTSQNTITQRATQLFKMTKFILRKAAKSDDKMIRYAGQAFGRHIMDKYRLIKILQGLKRNSSAGQYKAGDKSSQMDIFKVPYKKT